MKIKFTKEWLNQNSKSISKISLPNYGTGYVRWIVDEKIDFMIEQDDGSFVYHIVTFDYIIEHKNDIVIYIEEKVENES